MPRSTWFCVDIECSGPVPALYDMISVGVVVVGPLGQVAPLEEAYYAEIKPTAPRVDPGAMAVNGLDIEALRLHGRPLSEVLREISAFVASRTAHGSTPVFVGHNAPFDWSFISYAYHAAGVTNPFGYKALDTKALAMGALGLHWLDTSKEILEKRLKLPPVEAEKVHRADYDAWYQAHILVRLIEAMRLDN